jgi:hypothetical protein
MLGSSVPLLQRLKRVQQLVVEGVQRKLTKCQGVRKMIQQCVSEESFEVGGGRCMDVCMHWVQYACIQCALSMAQICFTFGS